MLDFWPASSTMISGLFTETQVCFRLKKPSLERTRRPSARSEPDGTSNPMTKSYTVDQTSLGGHCAFDVTDEPASEANGHVDLERIRLAVREILYAVGEDPDREGLRETPD